MKTDTYINNGGYLLITGVAQIESDNKNWIDVEINDEDQKLAALISGAAAFALVGGAPLMLTESVENGSDAIEEATRDFGKKSKGTIIIQVDSQHKKIFVKDDGTGILHPIHVLKKPFKSLKQDVDYAKGQFGRGLQGFRKFCKNLTYISKRVSIVDDSEKSLKKGTESGETIILSLKNDQVKGSIEIVSDEKFSKFSNFDNGTVAIYENWIGKEFERLDLDKLKSRTQHHFGELIRKNKIKIVFQINNQPEEELQPTIYNEEHRIPLDPISVKDAGTTLGTINPYLYYTSRTEKSDYKKPFLLVGGRPLGNSFLCDFPEFMDQDVWKSQYITGYIECNFIKPNALRIALEPGKEKDLFIKHVRDAASFLQLKIREFQAKLFDIQMKEEMNDLVVEMQLFLRDKKAFTFPAVVTKGLLAESQQEDWVDTEEGKGDLPVIGPEGTKDETVKVGEAQDGKGPGSGDDDRKVKLDPELKGHKPRRKRNRKPSGFGIDFEPNELSDDLSWFDEVSKTVIINTAHARFKYLHKKTMEKGEESSFYKQLRKYIAENYLWQITNQLGTKSGLQHHELVRKFFDLKFEFFEKRPSW